MRAMKLGCLTLALFAFGCERSYEEQQIYGEEELGGEQGLGEQVPGQDPTYGTDDVTTQPGTQGTYGEQDQYGTQPMGEEQPMGRDGSGDLGTTQQPGMQPGTQQPGMQPGTQQPGAQPGTQVGQQPTTSPGAQQQPGMQQQPGYTQPGAQPGTQVGQGTQMGQQGLGQQMQTVRATVQEVDFSSGELTVTSDQGETLELHARPFDLGQVVQGDVIQVTYAQFGSEMWVMPAQQAQQNLAAYGTPQTLTGTVEELDLQEGQLTVQGQEIMAHPAQLQNYQQGQSLQIQYVTIEGQHWATTLQPMPAGPQQGT